MAFAALETIGLTRSDDGALVYAIYIGFPVVVIPSFALAKGEGEIASGWLTLPRLFEEALSVSPTGDVGIGRPA
jgi:hypothetical protein